MESLVKFPLITIEKWEGPDATDSSGKRVFLWEEDAWVNSAKKLKAKNPNVSVVPWMDTTLIYTGWMLDGSSNLNHTLNPSAQGACATGHFRPAEFIDASSAIRSCLSRTQKATSQPSRSVNATYTTTRRLELGSTGGTTA